MKKFITGLWLSGLLLSVSHVMAAKTECVFNGETLQIGQSRAELSQAGQSKGASEIRCDAIFESVQGGLIIKNAKLVSHIGEKGKPQSNAFSFNLPMVGKINVNILLLDGFTTLHVYYAGKNRDGITELNKTIKGVCTNIWFHARSDELVCETKNRQFQLNILPEGDKT